MLTLVLLLMLLAIARAIGMEAVEVQVAGTTVSVVNGVTYDDNDNLATATDLDGADAFTYDEVDRLVEVQYGDDGTEQTFAYDDAGNITDQGGDYAGFSAYTFTYNHEDGHSYDAVGNLTDPHSSGSNREHADFREWRGPEHLLGDAEVAEDLPSGFRDPLAKA